MALVEAGARPAEDPGRTDAILRLIRQWAAAEPAAAAGWALRQRDIPADLALAAVFDALAAQPDLAVEFALTFTQQHPERADDIGRYLIAALSRAGAYEHAAAFAASGEGNAAVDWITAAYFNWGRNDPQRALRTVEAMSSADLRQTAFQALVSGWAKTDPVRLLENYPAFPPGWDQRFAVVTGLRAWIELDPEAAAEWVKRARLPFDPDWELVLAD